MDSSAIVEKYFPQLSAQQKAQFQELGNLYADWNEKINVISRKDIEHIYEKHILHALAIAKFQDLSGKKNIGCRNWRRFSLEFLWLLCFPMLILL